MGVGDPDAAGELLGVGGARSEPATLGVTEIEDVKERVGEELAVGDADSEMVGEGELEEVPVWLMDSVGDGEADAPKDSEPVGESETEDVIVPVEE